MFQNFKFDGHHFAPELVLHMCIYSAQQFLRSRRLRLDNRTHVYKIENASLTRLTHSDFIPTSAHNHIVDNTHSPMDLFALLLSIVSNIHESKSSPSTPINGEKGDISGLFCIVA
jgi:hypothetical protein